MEINDYIQMGIDMRSRDAERNKMFEAIDDMWHGNWDLPTEIGGKSDLRSITDMSPHDALKSGTAIIANSMPHWKCQPLVDQQAELQRAESIAYGIDYNYKLMCRRGKSTLFWDSVHSCLRYDSIAIWLDYLPYQFKGKTTLRQKHAMRGGDFVGKAYSPRDVHIMEDDYGNNTVLLCTNLPAKSVVSKWGYRAKDLQARITVDKDPDARFVYNDLMVYEGDNIRRVAWGYLTEDELNIDINTVSGNSKFVLINELTDLPFMQWVVKQGGSGLESLSQYSVHPLLAPLYWSHKWKDLNIFQSVMQTEIIKYGRAPRVKTITPSGDGVMIDYEDGSTLNLKTGEEADAWRPAPIDPNMKELVDRVRAEVSASTLPRILQNPEFAGNTPFASINAMIQTALGGLNPAKMLCERAHEELAMKMLEWSFHEKKPLLSYKAVKSVRDGAQGAGTFVNVPWEQLDPEGVIIKCELFAEAPTDFQQRLQAGIAMNQQLNVPRAEILPKLGMDNVDTLYDQWVQEKEDDMMVQIDLQTQMATAQSAVQLQSHQAQMQLQMEAQQKQMQMQGQQAQGQQAQGQPQKPADMQGSPQAMDLGLPPGEGLNPNMTGQQQPKGETGQLNPSAGLPGVSSREMTSGVDVTGAPIG